MVNRTHVRYVTGKRQGPRSKPRGPHQLPGSQRRLFMETRGPKYGIILSRVASWVEMPRKVDIVQARQFSHYGKRVPLRVGTLFQRHILGGQGDGISPKSCFLRGGVLPL